MIKFFFYLICFIKDFAKNLEKEYILHDLFALMKKLSADDQVRI